MKKFGYARLFREDIGFWHKIYFYLFGVSPDHKLRFMYFDKTINSNLNCRNFNSILDAGCGSGDYSFYLADKFPDAKITSIDIDGNRISRNISLANKIGKGNIKFVKDDINALDGSEKYDLICCIDVLEHIEDVNHALSLLMGSLNDKGWMYIHFPTKKEKKVFFEKYLKEFHAWSQDEHVAESLTSDELLNIIEKHNVQMACIQKTFNHYLGEMCVSLIMLFYKDTAINRFVKTLIAPFMIILVKLDFAIKNKKGNAVSILLKKGKP